jgi:hypothetical protein
MRVVLNGGPRLVVVMALLLLLCTRVQNSVHSYNCSCVHKSYEHNVSTNEANAESKPIKHCTPPVLSICVPFATLNSPSIDPELVHHVGTIGAPSLNGCYGLRRCVTLGVGRMGIGNQWLRFSRRIAILARIPVSVLLTSSKLLGGWCGECAPPRIENAALARGCAVQMTTCLP